MEVYKKAVRNMNGNDLVNLARALDIPLSVRMIKKDILTDMLLERLDGIAKSLGPGPREQLHDPAVEISGLHKKYGRKVAVRSLDLVVRPGEIVGLVGPNGAGKSTTLRVLTGIIRANSGSVMVNGYDVSAEPLMAKQKIGYIPERPTCYPSLRVREYLTFMARVYGVPKFEGLIRTSEYVDLFQLREFSSSYIGTLSKGNLQRTLLAGIFVREPPFILALDEPIYGLDPRGAWSLKKLLKQLKREGSAILVSTHILEMAELLCDRFVVIDDGAVVGRGTLEELRTNSDGAKSLEEVFLKLTGGIPED